MNKEEIYDSEIHPLMDEIIKVCKANGIAMVASFAIPTEEDEGLCCTTLLPDGEGKNPPAQKAAYQTLRGEHPTTHLRTEHGDGSVTLTAFL